MAALKDLGSAFENRFFQVGLALLAMPPLGYAMAGLIGALLQSESLPIVLALPLNYLWYGAYFGAFLYGLLFGVPTGLVLMVVGVLRRDRREIVDGKSRRVRRGWQLVGVAAMCGYVWFGRIAVTSANSHKSFSDVRLGQTRADVHALIGLPGSISTGPCKDDRSVTCAEEVFYGTNAWGSDSGWRMAVNFRSDLVSGGRIVNPQGARQSLTAR